MTTKNIQQKNELEDLSYFTLTLQSYLNESFPEFSTNKEFIRERGEYAAQTYAEALRSGHSHQEASDLSNEVLFDGLHFSKFDTLFKVVSNEFDSVMADEDLRPFTLKVYPNCQEVFNKYPVNEEGFANSPTYDLLYTELTGTAALYIEENGVW